MDLLTSAVLDCLVIGLPLKCLGRLRCTCKRLYHDPIIASRVKKLIEEPNLLLVTSHSSTHAYCDKEKPRFEVGVDSLKASIPVDMFPSRSSSCRLLPCLLGSCDGLICLGIGLCSFFLVNPLLEEALLQRQPPWRTHCPCHPRTSVRNSTFPRPDPPVRDILIRSEPIFRTLCASGLGLDYVTGEYKLLLISSSGWAMFLILGKRSSRLLSVINDSYSDLRPRGPGIFLCGTLYWTGNPPSMGMLVTFDVVKEEFGFLLCPTGCGSTMVLVELGSHLGLAGFNTSGRVDVWELDNNHTRGWAKKYEFNFPPLVDLCSDETSWWEFIEVLGTWQQKIVLKVRRVLYSYDPRSRKLERVDYPSLEYSEAYCIRGGLASPHQFI